ncbi:MAG: SpoIIE family protein phosphatase [Pseudomonadota bacterium]
MLVGVIPLSLFALRQVQNMRGLGDELSSQSSQVLEEQALASINRVVEEFAKSLERESRRIETIVRLQAREAERLLRQPVVSEQVYFSSEFDARDPDLGLFISPDRYQRIDDERQRVPIPVSDEHQVFHAPGRVDRATLLDDAKRLVPMQALYQQFRHPDDRLLHWHYVALGSGLLATFPGHGGYPSSFDARTREWFREQLRAPGFRWFRTHVDASSGTLVINATMPILNDSGQLLGVTGVDINLIETFSSLELPDHLKPGSELMQVLHWQGDGIDEDALLLLARQSMPEHGSDWQTLPELEEFRLPNPFEHQEFLQRLKNQQFGAMPVTLNNEDYFLVAQPLTQTNRANSALILVAVSAATATSIAQTAAEMATKDISKSVRLLFRGLTFLVIVIAIAAVFAARHVSNPLTKLNLAFTELAKGQFETRVEIKTGDEIEQLGERFNMVAPRLGAYAALRSSLEVAREVQQHLLPKAAPEISGYDLHGHTTYSEQTGGDLFDFFSPDPKRSLLDVMVADVSGHGTAPALIMTSVRTLWRSHRRPLTTIDEVLQTINPPLSEDLTRGHFVTLYALSLDHENHRLHWCSAGHDPAMLWRAHGEKIESLAGRDIPLGVDASWRYSQAESTAIEEGDVLVIGTDGAWESQSPDGSRFGKARIEELIATHHDASAAVIAKEMDNALTAFREGNAQTDDVTIVVVKRITS